ncbi:MAG: metallophosphoesterase [Clostridia bacterium]|nr:metallophosphoesterase [Clostridia bacterium]
MGLWKTVCAASGAVAVGLAGWAIYDNRRPAGKTYTLEHPDLPPAFDGLRILHLSDLHATMFGKEQERLLSIVDSLEADIAFITGDLIDRRRTMTRDDMTPALLLLEQLAKRLPTVRVDGNHELMSVAGKQFVALADRTGAHNVTGRGLTLRRGDDRLVLVGIPDMMCVDEDEDAWRQIVHTVCAPYANDFRIALSHRPQFLEDYAAEGLPLVFSGHAHGGQVRLPLIGGLYAPEQGILPTYSEGIYTCGDTHMLVSRGLGNSGFPLRFANRPEVGLVTLKKSAR